MGAKLSAACTGSLVLSSFSIAVNRRVKDSKTNEWRDDTFFMPIVVWREQAERCKEKLSKGSPVSVEGRLRCRVFEDKSGQKRTVFEVEANRVQFLTSPTGEGAPEGSAPRSKASRPPSGKEEGGAEQLEEVPF